MFLKKKKQIEREWEQSKEWKAMSEGERKNEWQRQKSSKERYLKKSNCFQKDYERVKLQNIKRTKKKYRFSCSVLLALAE